jgi:hypothetical protein
MLDHWLSKLNLGSAYRFTRAALNAPSCAKKTQLESALTTQAAAYITTYETLRAKVLAKQSQSEGMAALRYHGMLPGLEILFRTEATPPAVTHNSFNLPLPRGNNAIIRLLANFMLHTYLEHTHVC